jgi:hypothetical protein
LPSVDGVLLFLFSCFLSVISPDPPLPTHSEGWGWNEKSACGDFQS